MCLDDFEQNCLRPLSTPRQLRVLLIGRRPTFQRLPRSKFNRIGYIPSCSMASSSTLAPDPQQCVQAFSASMPYNFPTTRMVLKVTILLVLSRSLCNMTDPHYLLSIFSDTSPYYFLIYYKRRADNMTIRDNLIHHSISPPVEVLVQGLLAAGSVQPCSLKRWVVIELMPYRAEIQAFQQITRISF